MKIFAIALVLLLILIFSPARAASLGLDVAEALIEDLSARNLAIYDRELLIRSASPTGTLSIRARSGPATVRVPGNLEAYMKLLSRTSPGGIVTGRFHDWRTPSVYRLVGGLHNGYDIAFPPGTAIVAGWPGRVVAVTPWYGAEYGITVASEGGYQTTYGHLVPTVSVGDSVRPGDVVGRVVNDHVDIKMRSDFGYVDFGNSVPGSGGVVAAGGGPGGLTLKVRGKRVTAANLPPLPGPAWTRDGERVRAALAYLRARHAQARLTAMDSENIPAGHYDLAHRKVEQARTRLERLGVSEEVLLAALPGEKAVAALPELRELLRALGN
ncbi:MAG: hypothetical protein FJX76_12995 [Armatimonadetes bacterium]|nr:hypothetical protein [Armatimonadota bacterium]